jgi:hypothetical protein
MVSQNHRDDRLKSTNDCLRLLLDNKSFVRACEISSKPHYRDIPLLLEHCKVLYSLILQSNPVGSAECSYQIRAERIPNPSHRFPRRVYPWRVIDDICVRGSLSAKSTTPQDC